MAKKKSNEDPSLDAKAEQIRELHQQCEDFTRRTEEAAKEAALKAWEAGKRLLEVKESLRHGEWIPWLQKQLPQLSQATVYRYRKIAEFFKSPEEAAKALEEHGCLKGLYRAAGAIGSEGNAKQDEVDEDDHEPDPEPAETASIVRLQRTLHRLRNVEKDVEKLVGELPQEVWTANEKLQLISTTKALLRIVDEKGWWDEVSAGRKPINSEEVPDAA
jgi:hypothetical protein